LAVAPASDAASLNLASALVNAGRLDEASQVARWLRDRGAESWARAVADATVGVIDASVAGEITSHIRHLTRLAEQDARSGNEHFHGVALLNLANAYRAVGDAKRAHALARRSIAIHQRTGAKPEEVSARLASAWALAHDADLAAARVEYGIALDMAVGRSRLECVNEIADLETWYGDSATAHQVLASVKPLTADAEMIDLLTSSRIQVMLRVGARETLADELSHLRFGFPCSVTGHEARRQALRAHVAVELGLGDAGDLAADAQLFAERQSAEFWARYVSLLVATTASRELFNGTLFEIASGDPTTCSLLAERIAKRLQDVEPATMRLIETEVQRRPERWRTALRTVVELYEPQGQNAAALLDIIGTREDVARLRQYARRTRRGDKSLGFALARRLAPRVFVEDQGQVEIHIGDRVVLGAKLRRKVLSLLCFLLTRRGLSATRDEVLEALWSDMDPGVALNSLNQTIYFLRRIFEPDYKDDLSPGYISHGSDLVWLDRELIASRSGRCRDLLDRAARTRAWDDVVALAEMYEGRFALDFAYEEWAASYRDSLHAGYLETLETAIANQLQDDRVELAIALARRAIDVDPDADELEVSLLRLYRASGAAAAAAEQYGHYAALARGTFGTEPPSLDALVEDR
jgi:DNA-binding SARP family transcriptional activator